MSGYNEDDEDEFDGDLGEQDDGYDFAYWDDLFGQDGQQNEEPSDEEQDDESEESEDEEEEGKKENDEEEEEGAKASLEKVKQIENKAKAAKKAGKLIKKGSFIVKLFVPPTLYITLGVLAAIILLIIIIAIVSALSDAPYENVDVGNGVFDTAQGITGEQFYGARIVYRDDEKAVKDLEYYYENLSTNYLSNVGELTGVTLKIDLEYSTRPEEVTALIEIMANVISGSETALSLEESLKLIDHFGYTDYELNSIRVEFITYITSNLDKYYTLDTSYTKNFETDLEWVFNINYSKLNTISKLYYVKDVLLTGDEMISGLENKNYMAMIYMPRTNVEISEASYMFHILEGQENAKINFKMISVDNGTENVIIENEVDSSWWGDNEAEQISETEKINLNLSSFISIDHDENILTGVSSYSLIYNDEYLSLQTENIARYFKINTITGTDGEAYEYYEIDYLPSLDDSYLYLSFDANCLFQFCEHDISID